MNQTEPTRTRQHGTRVTKPTTPEERMAAIQAIVDESQYAKVDGTMIDGYSASAILAVYRALNPANRTKFASLPSGKMGLLAFQLMNKQKGITP